MENNATELAKYLQSGEYIDSDHPAIQRLAKVITDKETDDLVKAVKIYYTVRDRWRYYPYDISFKPDSMRASVILEKSSGHCLDKAIVMIALLRAAGIPARLGLAKVKNHIAAERMVEVFNTDELVPHGYVDVWLKGKWVKATPAFNQSLCQKLGVATLEFDGTKDSLFQEFDQEGQVFMKYLEDYGTFEDFPETFAFNLIQTHYPKFFAKAKKAATTNTKITSATD